MSNVIRLKTLRSTTEVETQIDRELTLYRTIEVEASVAYLRRAADGIEHAEAWGLNPANAVIISDVKAALFHLLTLAGCRSVDRPLRDLLREC